MGKRKGKGRPLKYLELFHLLEDDELYTPSKIADLLPPDQLMAMFPGKNTKYENLRLRIRITFGRFTHNHKFPRHGDGLVTRPGQPTIPGWFGFRWKEAAGIFGYTIIEETDQES